MTPGMHTIMDAVGLEGMNVCHPSSSAKGNLDAEMKKNDQYPHNSNKKAKTKVSGTADCYHSCKMDRLSHLVVRHPL